MIKLLEITDVKKEFHDGLKKKIVALNGVELIVSAAESVSIVGQSGAGKSALMHILGGLDSPTSGTVLYNGTKIHELKSDKLAEWRNKNLGFVFQAHHLLNDLSARENVAAPQMIMGVDRKVALECADKMLAELGLQDRINHKVLDLSGGEKQRVAIGRALINQPKLILADEPTGNLDEKTGTMAAELMLETCRKANAALIVVTHNPFFAKMTKRCLLLENGKLIDQNI